MLCCPVVSLIIARLVFFFIKAGVKALRASLLIFIKSSMFCQVKYTFSGSFYRYTYFNRTEGAQLFALFSLVILESPTQVIGCWNAHWHLFAIHVWHTYFQPTVISKLISRTDSPRVPAVAACQGMKLVTLNYGRKDKKEKKTQNTISNLTPSLTFDEPWSGAELMPDLDTSKSGRKLSRCMSESFRP